MNAGKLIKRLRQGLLSMGWVMLLSGPVIAQAALEQNFPMLQIGTTTYRNVTITTKNKNYIFLLHSQGMANIKVADLSPELRNKLGYEDPSAHAKTNNPAAWARQTLTKLDVPQVKQVREELAGVLHSNQIAGVRLPALTRNLQIEIAAALLALYLLHCYICLQICRKAGAEPGILIWVPIVQLLPLLKAAGMSPWWFLGFFVPVLNLVAQILWCFKITQARGKTMLVALLLIFPLSSPLAVLYLAFSGSPRERKSAKRIEIMTLEAA